MDEIFNKAFSDKIFKSAVVLYGDVEKINYHTAFGDAKLTTAFELGYLTQPLCTALLTMFLTVDHNLNLNSVVKKYLPPFGEEGKDKITIKQLLKHTSGLPLTRPYISESLSHDAILEKICYEELEFPPGFEKKMSCLGYIVLCKIIENIGGVDCVKLFEQRVAKPLSLSDTTFGHDFLGHTGLISNTTDCWKIAKELLASYQGTKEWVQKPTLEEFVGTKVRYKLGWDIGAPPFSSNSIGMVSDTGCVLWIDLLKNRIIEIFTKGADKPALEKWLSTVYPYFFPV